jgi:hypothetical protein
MKIADRFWLALKISKIWLKLALNEMKTITMLFSLKDMGYFDVNVSNPRFLGITLNPKLKLVT